jgi:hypothetical protein
MKKRIGLALMGLFLAGLGFWTGRRSVKPLLLQVYDPQTQRWENIQIKTAKGRSLSLYCTDGEAFMPCVDYNRSEDGSGVLLVPTNELGPGNSVQPYDE